MGDKNQREMASVVNQVFTGYCCACHWHGPSDLKESSGTKSWICIIQFARWRILVVMRRKDNMLWFLWKLFLGSLRLSLSAFQVGASLNAFRASLSAFRTSLSAFRTSLSAENPACRIFVWASYSNPTWEYFGIIESKLEGWDKHIYLSSFKFKFGSTPSSQSLWYR